jgi:putative tricarboxylic transport membrane protein
MLTRRDLLCSAALVPAGTLPLSLLTVDRAQAQSIDLLKIFVPAAPGGGWDQTARTIEQVLRATAAVKGVQITNVGGAGGTVGLPQFLNQWKGQGNALMVAGMVMVGAIIANKSPVRLAQATPIARLTGEYQALVVPAPSPFKSAKDFAAALKADPTKVPVAGGSAGGSDHILLGMIAKAIGVSPTKVSYVAFAGGGPATAALLGNQVAAGISGYGEFAEQVKAGKLRLLAVSSDKRLEGIAAPTLKEEGIDVELANWRGVFAPPGVNEAQRKAMIALMEKMTASPQWAEACKLREWTPITLVGDGYKTFLDAETARIEGILKELGLA